MFSDCRNDNIINFVLYRTYINIINVDIWCVYVCALHMKVLVFEVKFWPVCVILKSIVINNYTAVSNHLG